MKECLICTRTYQTIQQNLLEILAVVINLSPCVAIRRERERERERETRGCVYERENWIVTKNSKIQRILS